MTLKALNEITTNPHLLSVNITGTKLCYTNPSDQGRTNNEVGCYLVTHWSNLAEFINKNFTPTNTAEVKQDRWIKVLENSVTYSKLAILLEKDHKALDDLTIKIIDFWFKQTIKHTREISDTELLRFTQTITRFDDFAELYYNEYIVPHATITDSTSDHQPRLVNLMEDHPKHEYLLTLIPDDFDYKGWEELFPLIDNFEVLTEEICLEVLNVIAEKGPTMRKQGTELGKFLFESLKSETNPVAKIKELFS